MDEIHDALGGSKQTYVLTVGGEVVAVCLNTAKNPQASRRILVGTKPRRGRRGAAGRPIRCRCRVATARIGGLRIQNGVDSGRCRGPISWFRKYWSSAAATSFGFVGWFSAGNRCPVCGVPGSGLRRPGLGLMPVGVHGGRVRRNVAGNDRDRAARQSRGAENDEPLLLSAATYSIEDQMDSRFMANRDLRGADLSRMHLCHAELSWANLTGADLSASDLEGASLCGAMLNGASLRGANLAGADLTDADLQGADLAHVCYTKATRWPEGFTPPMPAECGD